MVKKARGIAFSLVVTGGIIAGLALLADRFDLGTRLKQAAFSAGEAGGNAISQPIAGIAGGLTEGLENIRKQTQELAGQLGGAGADVQETFTGDRNAISNFQKCLADGGDFFCCATGSCNGGGAAPQPKDSSRILDISKIFSQQQTNRRISEAIQRAQSGTGGTAFGGFDSAEEQERRLQEEIQKTREQFPQFFS